MGESTCKLTQEVEDRILAALRAGNFRDPASRAAGITRRTLVRWLAAGRDHPRSRFGRFRRAVLEAEKDAEANALNVIIGAGPEDWKAAAWFLERRFPHRWARAAAQRLELTGKDGGPIAAELLHGLTDEERASRIAAILGIGVQPGGSGALPYPATEARALPAFVREEEVAAVAWSADGGDEQQG